MKTLDAGDLGRLTAGDLSSAAAYAALKSGLRTKQQPAT